MGSLFFVACLFPKSLVSSDQNPGYLVYIEDSFPTQLDGDSFQPFVRITSLNQSVFPWEDSSCQCLVHVFFSFPVARWCYKEVAKRRKSPINVTVEVKGIAGPSRTSFINGRCLGQNSVSKLIWTKLPLGRKNVTPAKTNECPLKRDYFNRKYIF